MTLSKNIAGTFISISLPCNLCRSSPLTQVSLMPYVSYSVVIMYYFLFLPFKIHKALCTYVCIHVLCVCLLQVIKFSVCRCKKKRCVATSHLIPRYPIFLSGYYRYIPLLCILCVYPKKCNSPFTVCACQHSDFRRDL